jgi:hypothetical protein
MVIKGLDLELSIMQNVAVALGQLDPPARARVLHWLQERFELEAAPSVEPATPAPAARTMLRAVPPPVTVADEALSVETLADMFSPRQATPPPDEAAPKTITGLLTEFVTEFQDIAREWDDACAAPVEAPSAPRRLSAAS